MYSRLSGCYWQTKLVGLLDADVYGPSIPKMMNLKGPVPLNKRKILFNLYFSVWIFLQSVMCKLYCSHVPSLYKILVDHISSSSWREFSAVHARNRTWRALHCQSLKHKLKKCDLSLHLKECKLSAWRTAAGKLCHTTGPATEKALSPNFVLVHGTE